MTVLRTHLGLNVARVGLSLSLLAGLCLPATADDELAKRASWSAPSAEQVKERVDQWLATIQIDDLTRMKIEALWPVGGEPVEAGLTGGSALLTQVATTIAVVDDRARALVELCQNERRSPAAPQFDFLSDEGLHPFVRSNLQLYLARWLAQHDLYDEALDQIRATDVNAVVDPASLLFYQSTGYHRLSDKEKCLPAINRLLEHEPTIPRRYATVARLMKADLEPLKADSLDEVARLMDDIRRRLSLSRAGTHVRKQEDDVIAKLDKMIEDLEQQQQQQQQQSAAQGGSTQSSKPAEDSVPLGGLGPGNVDPRRLEGTANWGNLPPRERQESLQRISKDLPAHYREVIEEYFKKIARDGG